MEQHQTALNDARHACEAAVHSVQNLDRQKKDCGQSVLDFSHILQKK